MSDTQAKIDGAAPKTQKRDLLLGKLWCIVAISLWGYSHAMHRYHENIKLQQRQDFARAIDRAARPQSALHVDLGKNKVSGSQADAVLHQK